MKTLYTIIRYRQYGENEVIKKGLTLEQAQAHCSDEKTKGEGWFDGYIEQKIKQYPKSPLLNCLRVNAIEKGTYNYKKF